MKIWARIAIEWKLRDEQNRAGVFNMHMDLKRIKQGFIRLIRIYPLIAIGLLIIAYLLGGFSEQSNPLVPRTIVLGMLYGLIIVVPLLAILIFVGFSVSEDRSRNRNLKSLENLPAEDPFDLAQEEMCGFKIVSLTGELPIFTGVTGDTYKNDENAICKEFPDHVPPVIGCECGFYAFKNRRDAQFELSIHPGLFLIDVDLFGIGFSHKYGYRAESQRVNSLEFPKRCMRCKVLPARVFIKSYKIGYGNNVWWHWSVRCSLCVKGVKPENRLTIEQMSQKLNVEIN
ncbi:MAG: hypothetical protein EXQ80_06515 [Candidatus Nanopelagicaceae bacterium]|nr:hypothetical protein [Candidatus Nanopelagicaceae bacterium]